MNLGLSDLSLGIFGSGGGGFVSVDFGASSIKVAEGTYQGGDSPQVNMNLADKESVGNPAPNERIQEFSNSLETLLERNSIPDDQKVVLALPTNIVIVRHLELPAMPDERMSQVIRYEAESHIPFPLEEVVLDYHVLERTEEATEIILIAVKEEKLNEYVEIAHNAGLDPEIIDISAFSLFNLYRKMEANGDASNGDEEPPSKVLVDIGHANTDIIIFKGETLHFARSASVAGESITEQIAKKLGVELDEAEQLKREYGHIPLEEVEEIEDEELDEDTTALDEISSEGPSDEEETTASEEPQSGEDLDVGAPAPPGDEEDGSETVDAEPSEPAETEEATDEGGIDLGTPKAPEPTGEEEDETVEPESHESGEEPESGGIDLGTPKEPEDTAETDSDTGSGSQTTEPDQQTPDTSASDEDEDEDGGEGIDLGLGSPRTPSSPAEGESTEGTEEPPSDRPEEDEMSDETETPAEPTEEIDETDESEQDTPPAPTPPPQPGESETGESEGAESEDLTEGESISLGDTTKPSEEDVDTDDEDEEQGDGDLNLGNTLSGGDDSSEDDEDDDDDSSLSLGAAENSEGEDPEQPESDVDRGKVGRAIKPQIDRLIGELRHTFDYFQSQLGGGEVDEVIIVGGGSELKNISAYVEDQLDRPASKFHPEEQVHGVPEEQLQSYLVSAGLTLRTLEDVADLEINLIPDDIVQQRQSRNVQKKLTAMGVLGALLFVQLIGSAYFFYSSRHHEKLVSQREFEKLESIVNRVESLKERQSELDKRLGVIENLENEKTDMLALMRALDQLPQDLRQYTWFKNMSFQASEKGNGQLDIAGVTQDFDDTSRIYQWLESIEYIETINDQSQQKENYTINGEQRKLVSFSATCVVSFKDENNENAPPEEQT